MTSTHRLLLYADAEGNMYAITYNMLYKKPETTEKTSERTSMRVYIYAGGKERSNNWNG